MAKKSKKTAREDARPTVSKAALIRAAALARKSAVAPYSKFLVGAALLTRRGQVITGANVESASYGLTCCAERVALFKALTNGEKDFAAVAVVAKARGGATPCGACRQLLAEYAPKARVFVADCRKLKVIREFTVAGLLPGAFRSLD
ncbi:MAG: cytidine deaminase [Verrucomicrobia bacterium]|nr:MAG: cytidine deaminase [Verrucomicrobiota bacterium]